MSKPALLREVEKNAKQSRKTKRQERKLGDAKALDITKEIFTRISKCTAFWFIVAVVELVIIVRNV